METTGIIGLLVMIIFTLIPIAIIIAIVYFLVKVVKNYEKRANEKLEIEREHTIQLQKRVDLLDDRLVVIENMLKEVE